MRRTIVVWLISGCLGAAVPQLHAQALAQVDITLDATPLLFARQNLLMARSRVLERRYSEAAVSLVIAARGLAAFARQEPGPNGQAAEFTRQGIEDYAAVIENDHSDAVSRIDDWMSRIGQWGAEMPAIPTTPQ